MHAHFDHEKLAVYRTALLLVDWVDRLLSDISLGIAAKDHLLRATESIVRNIVRANTRRSPADRARTCDISYGSALECAACLDILHAWKAIEEAAIAEGKRSLDRIVAMLLGLRFPGEGLLHESPGEYRTASHGDHPAHFSHEDLRVYQSSLRFIAWSAMVIQSAEVGSSKGRELDRQSTSMLLNIAEGNGRFSPADRRRFLDIALGAGLQAASSLDILNVRNTISDKVCVHGKRHLGEIVAMIGALARSLET